MVLKILILQNLMLLGNESLLFICFNIGFKNSTYYLTHIPILFQYQI